MFELYEHKRDMSLDNWMAIIDNPDRELEGHQPFYDITITDDGQILHGTQWSQREVDALHSRVKSKSSVFHRVPVAEASQEIKDALLRELESEL